MESIPIADSLLNDALSAVFGFAGVVAGALLAPITTRRLENHRDLEHRMQRGPLAFGDPEPDLDRLRQAFLRAQAILDALHSELGPTSEQSFSPYVQAQQLQASHQDKQL